MNPPLVIDTKRRLAEFVEIVSSECYLAVDTESNSFYAYRPRTCLIQISSEHADFILDPLSLKDLSALGLIFADPAVEKVFHAAENDLIGLKRDFHFRFYNLFDTAVASRLVGRKRLGLAGILSEEFGVQMNKKFQRCNWEKRPLTPEQLSYAQLDTRFLIELRHRLYLELLEKNLWASARERFAALENTSQRGEKRWDPDGYLYFRGARELPAASLRVLRALYRYRERLARKADRAPFRIMNTEAMLRLAREMPADRGTLLKISGLPSRFKGKKAENLLGVIEKAKRADPSGTAETS
ncbi:MAG: ribonuclease D [Syntrophobacteria bacterium]